MRISYFTDESNNYVVRVHGLGVAVYSKGYFKKMMNIKGNVVMGSVEVSVEFVEAMGYQVPVVMKKVSI